MIPFILLFCVLGVAVLALATITSVVKQKLLERRELQLRAQAIRSRQAANEAALAAARVGQAVTTARVPTPPNGVVMVDPVHGLTGLIEKLEESARFARVPAAELDAPVRRGRVANGSVAPPVANLQPAAPAPRAVPQSVPQARTRR